MSDDHPSGTASDLYTIRVTASDDDGGESTVLVELLLRNAAPTVTIDAIEVLDRVLATDEHGIPTAWLNAGQLDESEGFLVRGTVFDPGLLDTHTATLRVDLNFDGDTGDEGESAPLTLIPVPHAPGRWTFAHTIPPVPDDGPSPGNHTRQDGLALFVFTTDDDGATTEFTATVEVHNVVPAFVDDPHNDDDQPSVAFLFDEEHNLVSAIVSGVFADYGGEDRHRLFIQWGDGVQGDGNTDPLELAAGERSFSVERPLDGWPAFDLYPIVVALADDDQGTAVWVIESSCACECAVGQTAGGVPEANSSSGALNAGQRAGPTTLQPGQLAPNRWWSIQQSRPRWHDTEFVPSDREDDLFGITQASASPVYQTRVFSLVGRESLCLIQVQTLLYIQAQKVFTTRRNGTARTLEQQQRTLAHETIHLDALEGVQEQLVTAHAPLNDHLRMLPADRRPAAAHVGSALMTTHGQLWLTLAAKIETIRQDNHLDHLTERIYVVAGDDEGIPGQHTDICWTRQRRRNDSLRQRKIQTFSV